MKWILGLVLFGVGILSAQPPASIIPVVVDPSGSCFAPTPMQFNSVNGRYWGCVARVWTRVADPSGTGFPAGTGAINVVSGVPGLVSGSPAFCVLVNGTSAACDAPGLQQVTNNAPVTAPTNTTAIQLLQAVAIPAGTFNIANTSYTVKSSGIYSTGTLQTPTVTMTKKLCVSATCATGTVVTLATWVSAASTQLLVNQQWNTVSSISTTTLGASGSVLLHGNMVIDLAAGISTTYTDGNSAPSSPSIDLTGILYVVDFVTVNSANSGNSFTQQLASLEPASAIGPTGPAGAGVTQIICGSGLTGGTITTTGTCSVTTPFTQSATVAIDNAHAVNMFSSPVKIIDAQGVGSTIKVWGCLANALFNTAAFTGGGNLVASYGSGSPTAATSATAAIGSALLTTFSANQVGSSSPAFSSDLSSSILNTAVYFGNLTGNFSNASSGQSTLLVTCWYTVFSGLQ